MDLAREDLSGARSPRNSTPHAVMLLLHDAKEVTLADTSAIAERQTRLLTQTKSDAARWRTKHWSRAERNSNRRYQASDFLCQPQGFLRRPLCRRTRYYRCRIRSR